MLFKIRATGLCLLVWQTFFVSTVSVAAESAVFSTADVWNTEALSLPVTSVASSSRIGNKVRRMAGQADNWMATLRASKIARARPEHRAIAQELQNEVEKALAQSALKISRFLNVFEIARQAVLRASRTELAFSSPDLAARIVQDVEMYHQRGVDPAKMAQLLWSHTPQAFDRLSLSEKKKKLPRKRGLPTKNIHISQLLKLLETVKDPAKQPPKRVEAREKLVSYLRDNPDFLHQIVPERRPTATFLRMLYDYRREFIRQLPTSPENRPLLQALNSFNRPLDPPVSIRERVFKKPSPPHLRQST